MMLQSLIITLNQWYSAKKQYDEHCKIKPGDRDFRYGDWADVHRRLLRHYKEQEMLLLEQLELSIEQHAEILNMDFEKNSFKDMLYGKWE